MIVRLKRSAWMLMLAAALMAMAFAAVLPGVAEAQQGADEATTSIPQSADQNTNQEPNQSATATAARPVSEAAASRVVINPGDTLWSIAQERLGPDATPGQVGDEVGRLYELNRDRIGDDPDLILAGQELFLPPAVSGSGGNEPSPAEPVAAEQPPVPTAAEATPQPSEESVPETAASEQPAPEQRAAAPEANQPARAPAGSSSQPDNTSRRAIGLGILALSLLLLLALVVGVARSLLKGRERRYELLHSYDDYRGGQEQEEAPQTGAGGAEPASSGGGTTEPSPELPTTPSGYARTRRRLRARRLRARRNRARSGFEKRYLRGGW